MTSTTDTATDIRTRRLIVTVPNVTGEEADVLLEDLDGMLHQKYAIGNGRGSAAHALDDAVIAGVRVGVIGVNVDIMAGGGLPVDLTRDEARKLAALLLRAADEAEA